MSPLHYHIYLIIVPFSRISLLNFIVANCVYSYPRRKVEWIDTINLAHLTRQLNPHCYIQSEQLLRKERDVSVPQHYSDLIIAQCPFTFIKSYSLWYNIIIPMFRLTILVFFYFLFTILILFQMLINLVFLITIIFVITVYTVSGHPFSFLPRHAVERAAERRSISRQMIEHNSNFLTPLSEYGTRSESKVIINFCYISLIKYFFN